MKIICVGRNYVEHAKELGNSIPSEPVLFLKPESALNLSGEFKIPKFSSEIHFELELVLKISKDGKNIPKENATQYFDEIALGIDFTARDLQQQLKSAGLPWEKSKAFDNSAVVSNFVDFQSLKHPREIKFQLFKNKELTQSGNTKDMIFDFGQIIENASEYFSLQKGDLIFTGTPEGVGKVNKNDILIAYLEETKLLEIRIC